MDQPKQMMLPSSIFSEAHPRLRLAHRPSSLVAYMADPMTYGLCWVHGLEAPGVRPSALAGTVYHVCRQEFDQRRLDGPVAIDPWLCSCAEHIRTSGLLAASEGKPRYHPDAVFNALVWYGEKYGNHDPVQPSPWGMGASAPIAEVPVAMQLPITAPTGEPYWLTTHYDLLCEYGGTPAIRELKTEYRSDSYLNEYKDTLQVAVQQLIQRHTFGMRFPLTIIDLTLIYYFTELIHKGTYASGKRAGQARIGLGARLPAADFRRLEIRLGNWELDRWLRNICYWIKRIEYDTLAGLFDEPTLAHCPWSPSGQTRYENKDNPAPMRDFCRATPDERASMLPFMQRKEGAV